MALAGYIWVPPDDTTETDALVDVSLEAAGPYFDDLRFVAPDLEGGRLHPTNPVGRLMDVCENLVSANKNILMYNRKGGWPTVMGGDVTEFSQWALWEARYWFKSGFKPETPPDIDWRWTPYGGWQERAILQYAGTAPVDGAGWSADWNVVDLDRLGFDLLIDTTTPVPQPKPTPPPAPTPPPPPPKPTGTREYKVTASDSDGLSGIAGRELGNSGRWPEIAALNPGVTPPLYVIYKGEILLLPTSTPKPTPPPAPTPPPTPTPKPGTRQYTVKSTDGAQGLSGIAYREMGSAGRWSEIARLNNMTSPYRIHAGQVLLLPTGRDVPKPTPPPTPAPTPTVKTHRVGPEGKQGLWGVWEARGRKMSWAGWYHKTCDLNGWQRGSSPVLQNGQVIKVAA